MPTSQGYRIYWTDETVVVRGVRRPGIPFVLDREMQPVTDINRYLYDECTEGSLRSWESRSKAARHAIKFQEFCAKRGIDWIKAQRKDLFLFREELMLETRKKDRAAVNEYLSRTCSTFEWAKDQRRIEEVPFGYKWITVHKPGLGASTKVRVNEFALKPTTGPPRTPFLFVDQVFLFYGHLNGEPEQLMAREGFQVGMRREEITRQTVDVLPDPGESPADHMITMTLDHKKTHTKGGVTREVLLTPRLAKDLWDYKENIRPALAAKYEAKYGRQTNLLFLSDEGDPLPRQYLNRVFARAAKKAGIRVTPHMLRHTYATHEFLRVLKMYAELQALEWVRDRLGHSSVVTTERYVHSAKLVSMGSMVDYQRHIDDMITGVAA